MTMMNSLKILTLSLSIQSCSKSDFVAGGQAPAEKHDAVVVRSDDFTSAEVDRRFYISPRVASVFPGEIVKFKSMLENQGEVSADHWSINGSDVAIIDSAGTAKAVAGGTTIVTATYLNQSDSATLNVIKCKSIHPGSPGRSIRVSGENWPGNSVDRGGSDFDDYFVIIAGNFIVDGYQIYAAEDQAVTVSFSIGTTGSTSQLVKMQIVDCDGNEIARHEVSNDQGTTTLKAAKGDRFNLFTNALTGSQTRQYDLIKDGPMAFRVTINN